MSEGDNIYFWCLFLFCVVRISPNILSNLPPNGSYWNVRSPKGESVWLWVIFFLINTMQKLSNLARKNGWTEWNSGAESKPTLQKSGSVWSTHCLHLSHRCWHSLWRDLEEAEVIASQPSAKHLSYLASHSAELPMCNPNSRERCIKYAGSGFPTLAWILSICPPPIPNGHVLCLKPTKWTLDPCDCITQRKKLLSNVSLLVIHYLLMFAEDSSRLITCLEII